MSVGMAGTCSLAGKIALVVGASRGIGAAVVRAMAAAGANVALASRDVAAMDGVARDLDDAATLVVRVDVTDASSLEAAVLATVQKFGRLDIAVNNAGTQIKRQPFTEIADSDFRTVVDVNLVAMFRAMQYELRAMLDAGGGSIINVSSVSGLTALPEMAPYVASKHGVIGLTKAAAIEHATRGIRVNAVVPGPTMTDMFRLDPTTLDAKVQAMTALVPMARIGDPDEIAASVVWLASDAASFVTGIALPVDGGFCIP